MRTFGTCISVVAISTAAASFSLSMDVRAAAAQWGLNGTYRATSNGEWSKTNEIYHDEANAWSIWTISTQCSYPGECAGTVTSDARWSAPIYQKSGVWYVKRKIDNWEPCPDGTFGAGLQVYRFAATTVDGSASDPNSPILTGEDQTVGQSGACGINKPLFISMPFKLVKN
ncbi:Rv2253/PknI dimerization domain-containing protein [Mycobacteroides abscessus]|uniref:hypothetical protein n=1 Tax=Mycobacteroides abscessus TaxID=36809 RepID=UPI0006ACE78D|nr:hypothetical protein BST18_05270 [Mycobacteroides abscessus subsp. bolletii]TPF67660.1 hypothetical protein XW60_14640 [Mycobacteroides abscessus subsp. bolletii]